MPPENKLRLDLKELLLTLKKKEEITLGELPPCSYPATTCYENTKNPKTTKRKINRLIKSPIILIFCRGKHGLSIRHDELICQNAEIIHTEQ